MINEMSELRGPKSIENHNERVVASISNTISKILTENGFFSVSIDDVDTDSKFSFLEENLPEFLTSEKLIKYLATAPKDEEKLAIISDLRNKILQKISLLFVAGDDFKGRFNEECRRIIISLANNSY